MISVPSLVGMGLYTPAEASRLVGIPTGKIVRWLRGHAVSGKPYDALWKPQIDLGDGSIYLGFRDLMELRTANAFLSKGVSAITIRKTIVEVSRLIGESRPLSTKRFKTDGRSIFLELVSEDGDTRLLDIFKQQYAFKKIIEQSLKDVEFLDDAPNRWWPMTRSKGIVVDPARSFGQPIDEESGVPTRVLATAVAAEGSVDAAARVWAVKPQTVRRAVEYENSFFKRAA